MSNAANGGGIGIPTSDAPMANGAPLDHQAWSSADAPSPSRTQGGGDVPPRRSSRSRSPGARDADRGYMLPNHRVCLPH